MHRKVCDDVYLHVFFGGNIFQRRRSCCEIQEVSTGDGGEDIASARVSSSPRASDRSSRVSHSFFFFFLRRTKGKLVFSRGNCCASTKVFFTGTRARARVRAAYGRRHRSPEPGVLAGPSFASVNFFPPGKWPMEFVRFRKRRGSNRDSCFGTFGFRPPSPRAILKMGKPERQSI